MSSEIVLTTLLAVGCIFQTNHAQDIPIPIPNPIHHQDQLTDGLPGFEYCLRSPRPSSGKVARLMLELLKSLEGEDGTLISSLTNQLVQSHLLFEASLLDTEPDLGFLVKPPVVMMGEPHAFPRVLGMLWLVATDAQGAEKNGWCDVEKVHDFMSSAKPLEVARQVRSLDKVLGQSRWIIEDFVQSMDSMNISTVPGFEGTESFTNESSSTQLVNKMNEPPTRIYEIKEQIVPINKVLTIEVTKPLIAFAALIYFY